MASKLRPSAGSRPSPQQPSLVFPPIAFSIPPNSLQTNPALALSRPPGPEPLDSHFCRPMQGFGHHPYSPVASVFSMTSRVSVLHRCVANCRLSMHEKGKKRAKSRKSLIRASLISTAFRHSISVVQAHLDASRGPVFEAYRRRCHATALANLQISSPFPEHPSIIIQRI